MKQTKTLQVRIRDKHAPLLREMARSVNLVWNYINALSSRSIRERGRFLSEYDIDRYTSGSSKLLGIPSGTIQCISAEYTTRRKQFKRRALRWRKSQGSGRSLGWIPFKASLARWKDGHVVFYGHRIKVWDSYGLGAYSFRSGSFTEDARGRWYFNVVVDAEVEVPCGQDAIGIDLGLATTATCSDGAQRETY